MGSELQTRRPSCVTSCRLCPLRPVRRPGLGSARDRQTGQQLTQGPGPATGQGPETAALPLQASGQRQLCGGRRRLRRAWRQGGSNTHARMHALAPLQPPDHSVTQASGIGMLPNSATRTFLRKVQYYPILQMRKLRQEGSVKETALTPAPGHKETLPQAPEGPRSARVGRRGQAEPGSPRAGDRRLREPPASAALAPALGPGLPGRRLFLPGASGVAPQPGRGRTAALAARALPAAAQHCVARGPGRRLGVAAALRAVLRQLAQLRAPPPARRAAQRR